METITVRINPKTLYVRAEHNSGASLEGPYISGMSRAENARDFAGTLARDLCADVLMPGRWVEADCVVYAVRAW